MHIMRSYFRGTQGILLVYDVTNEQSFRSAYANCSSFNLTLISSGLDIRNWHDEIAQHAPSDVCKILVGNKSDLVQECVVTEEQGRELANELGVKFMLTSAKSNEGVEGAFFSLARSILAIADFQFHYSCICFQFSDVKAVLVDDLAGGGQTRGPFQQRFVFGAIAILSLSSIVAFFLLTK